MAKTSAELEREMQLLLYNNTKVVNLKQSLSGVFNQAEVQKRVKGDLSSGSDVSFKKGTDWTMLALLYLADELGFDKKYKLTDAANDNPKLGTDFAYDKKKDKPKFTLYPHYDIISHIVVGEALKGIEVNEVFRTFTLASGDASNKNRSEAAKASAEKWYEKAAYYPLFCGPSSRGAKAYFAFTQTVTGSDLLLPGKCVNESLANATKNEDHPLLPVFAMLSVLTGPYGHHTFFEVLSGAIQVYPALTLPNCDIKWLKAVGTYSKQGTKESEIYNTKLLETVPLNKDINTLIKDYEDYKKSLGG